MLHGSPSSQETENWWGWELVFSGCALEKDFKVYKKLKLVNEDESSVRFCPILLFCLRWANSFSWSLPSNTKGRLAPTNSTEHPERRVWGVGTKLGPVV